MEAGLDRVCLDPSTMWITDQALAGRVQAERRTCAFTGSWIPLSWKVRVSASGLRTKMGMRMCCQHLMQMRDFTTP